MSHVSKLTITVDTSRCKRRFALLQRLPRWLVCRIPFDAQLRWIRNGARFSMHGKRI